MVGTYDNEKKRLIDGIKCIAFKEAKDAITNFINRECISRKLHRSIRWVSEWWTKTPDDCCVDYFDGGKEILSKKSKNWYLLRAISNEKASIVWYVKLSRNVEKGFLL
jgi:hypothetical protein